SNIIIKKTRKTAQLITASPVVTVQPFDGSIRGKVTDSKGEPLANASIVLSGVDKGTAANSKGEFVITGVKPGGYKLQVSAIGFQSITRNITVKDNEELVLNLQLSDNNNRLDEVVVTALGIKKEKKALGYSAQEVKGEDLV